MEDNITVDFKYLLDNYIRPYIAFYTAFEIQIPLTFKIKNKGVVKTTDEKNNNCRL